MKIAVSACLLGENCKYNGGNNYHEKLAEFLKGHDVVGVCPEVLGGLPTPRADAQRVGDKVIARTGKDVTAEYMKGAFEAVRLAEEHSVLCAIMKENADGREKKCVCPMRGKPTGR